MSKFTHVTVVVEKTFLIEMNDDERNTKVNGWSVEEVIQSWFRTHNINKHHATRDSSHVGGNDKILMITTGKVISI